MVKVCHMTSVHPPEDIRIFRKECVGLAKEGYDVTLIQPGESGEKEGVRILGIGTLTGNRLKRMAEGVKRVYRRALEADAEIYHFHDPELLLCALKLKRRGKHVVFDSHEKYSIQLRSKPYLPEFVSRLIARIYSGYEKYVLKRIDAVVFPCTIHGENPFAGQCRRAVLLNNLPLLEELYDKWMPEEKKEFRACYVGYVRPDRGNSENVRACNQAGVKLILAGGVSAPAYEGELRELDTGHLTEIWGMVNRQQVLQALRMASVGLVTELNMGQNNCFDNLPTKAYEYMAMGLPVIISHSEYTDALLERIPFGIAVDPARVEETADALRFLRAHPAEAKKMGEAGRRAVKEEFNWEVEQRKLFALYADILKDKGV